MADNIQHGIDDNPSGDAAKATPADSSGGLRERLCDLDFEIAPTSFFQINPWQAINLYRRIEQIAGED